MKHLKPFNESQSYSLEDVTSYIRDMLLDFLDEGFNVEIDSRSIDSFDNHINISIDTGYTPISGTPNIQSDLRISAEKIIELSERIESYFKIQNIVYDIEYQWHDNHGHFHDKKPTWPPGKIRNIWIEIFIEK